MEATHRAMDRTLEVVFQKQNLVPSVSSVAMDPPERTRYGLLVVRTLGSCEHNLKMRWLNGPYESQLE